VSLYNFDWQGIGIPGSSGVVGFPRGFCMKKRRASVNEKGEMEGRGISQGRSVSDLGGGRLDRMVHVTRRS